MIILNLTIQIQKNKKKKQRDLEDEEKQVREKERKRANKFKDITQEKEEEFLKILKKLSFLLIHFTPFFQASCKNKLLFK